MILIIGGKAQGKRSFVIQQDPETVLTDGAHCSPEDALRAACVFNYHDLIQNLLHAGDDPAAFTKRLCTDNPNCKIILNEIGSGIVPLDPAERRMRETVGICGCILAEHAETVVRMTCGIPTVLKEHLS
ncbi:MAG: bifunctional adenosylcobinamide kinase/adenosylcobinamide-phosphate guanylyltransferase [Oscillospiraceae bacterium]|nr:bifunctional adenosylcobinamide kinase/adenosylcobinamide-phosphate guanylyltransferase [Oscillospiraceae bacterium]